MPPLAEALSRNFPQLTLHDDQLARLAPLLPLKRLGQGALLFAQGQATTAFYMVAEGEIEARFTALDGKVSVLEHVGPPRIFGLAAFVTGKPSTYEVIAKRPSRLWVIGAEGYRVLMDEVPGFARALLAEFAGRYDGTLKLLEAARHRSAAERFAMALTQLRRERGSQPDGGGWIDVNATQTELASLASLSRQTVNLLLRQAVAEGRLISRYGRLRIKL